MHMNTKPFIIPFLCNKCNTCVDNCPVDAITIGTFSRIDRSKCLGCATCIAVCPKSAVIVNVFRALNTLFGNLFGERLAEYAYAAQKEPCLGIFPVIYAERLAEFLGIGQPVGSDESLDFTLHADVHLRGSTS